MLKNEINEKRKHRCVHACCGLLEQSDGYCYRYNQYCWEIEECDQRHECDACD